jgi:hypothetical protein
MSEIPHDYQWPGGQLLASSTGWHFWLTEQPDAGSTQRYMVIAVGEGEQHIAAERCYLRWGQRIVDALRAERAVSDA